MADTNNEDDGVDDRSQWRGADDRAFSERVDPVVDASADDDEDAERPWRTKDDKPVKKSSFLRETVIIVVAVLLISWILQTFIGRQYVIPSESMESTLIGCSGCSNDRIVVDKLAYRFGDPQPGDVIVFEVPEEWGGSWLSPRSSNPVLHKVQDALSWFGFQPPNENDYVKRIIAVGGQTIECKNSEGVGIKVNGKPLTEPYVDKALQQRELEAGTADPRAVDEDGKLNSCLGKDFGPITVPKDRVFVMGDNRTMSSDSRYNDAYKHGTIPVENIRGKTRFVIYPFSRIGGIGSINPQQ